MSKSYYLSPIPNSLSLSLSHPMLRNNPLFWARVPEISSGPLGAIPLPLFLPELICKSPLSPCSFSSSLRALPQSVDPSPNGRRIRITDKQTKIKSWMEGFHLSLGLRVSQLVIIKVN